MFSAPLLPSDVSEPADLVSMIRARRGGDLMNLDRKLLNSPPFCSGWNSLCGNVRSKLSLNAHLMELAILTTAVVNNVPYEFLHHLAPFLNSALKGEEERALKQGIFLQDMLSDDNSALTKQRILGSALFSEEEQLVIEIAVSISDFDTSDRARLATRSLLQKFEDQHGATAALELVGASSCYNMVSRFLIFTHVEPETEFSQAAADIVQAFRTRL
jgi:hypothetical protein